MKRLFILSSVLVGCIIGCFVLLAGVWLFTLRDPAPAQSGCAFESVSATELERLLAQAEEQDWTVWPGLSNGIFWPSDRGLKGPTPGFEKEPNARLESAIRQLAPQNSSADMQLAAAHAVMRSMKAEYVSVFSIPNRRENGELASAGIIFNYLLPQMRFAPLCFPCLVFWNTSIAIVFDHDLASNTYRFDRVNLLHSGLKYEAKFDRLSSTACPSFPHEASR